jgi:hypothetical protein
MVGASGRLQNDPADAVIRRVVSLYPISLIRNPSEILASDSTDRAKVVVELGVSSPDSRDYSNKILFFDTSQLPKGSEWSVKAHGIEVVLREGLQAVLGEDIRISRPSPLEQSDRSTVFEKIPGGPYFESKGGIEQ